jgi:polyferredoxin
LTLALLLIFITGIILSNMNGPEENGRILDLMNRLFLAIYIIVISLVIYIIFSLLSIPMFTNLILGAIYVIFLIIIFIVSMRDFFLIISGEGA